MSLLRLSRFIPVRMSSTYWVTGVAVDDCRERATWWQWRGRSYRRRVQDVV